jgi:hypothetical protein
MVTQAQVGGAPHPAARSTQTQWLTYCSLLSGALLEYHFWQYWVPRVQNTVPHWNVPGGGSQPPSFEMPTPLSSARQGFLYSLPSQPQTI